MRPERSGWIAAPRADRMPEQVWEPEPERMPEDLPGQVPERLPKQRPGRMWALLCAAMLGLGVVACDGGSPTSPDRPLPGWVVALTVEIQSAPVTQPPSSIWRYRYRGETVYFRPSRCCDVQSDLYDDRGILLCHPDGGISGNGDARCPDFFTQRTREQLIWQDPRS
jgi:hypothetical protein